MASINCSRFAPRYLLPPVLLLSASVAAHAQNPTGSVTGLVHDPSGAVVRDAAIVATDVDTKTVFKTASAADGNCNFPALPIGHYSIDVSSPGFKSDQRNGLTIVVDQHAQVDFALVAGSAGKVVMVSADSNQIETESHSVGTVVDQQKLDQLPLNSRNFNTLAYIVPAVFPPVFNSKPWISRRLQRCRGVRGHRQAADQQL